MVKNLKIIEYTFLIPGLPRTMPEDQFQSNFNEARTMLNDEANRTRGGFQPGGLGGDQTNIPQQPNPPPQHTQQQAFTGPTPQSAQPTPHHFMGQPQQQQPSQQQFMGPPQPQQPTQHQFMGPPQQPPQQNTQGGLFGPDPGFFNSQPLIQQQQSSNTNAQHIRAMMPFLAHLTDEYILSQPIDALYRLNREEKLADTTKANKGLEVKLYQNFRKAADNPIYLEGYDNRATLLHPARFLPGAGMSVQQQWLEARRLWGQEGKDAIANYDLETLGCSGCVTARGWEILHNPGSPELTLKLFTVSNVGHSATGAKTVALAGEGGFTIHENWKEVSDMGELKRALGNLLLAARLAMPWNFSFQVLEGFLKSNDYMESELTGLKKASVMSGFIDHVFKVNASLWVREVAFLDSAQLKALWNSWWCSRKAGAKTDPELAEKQQQHQHQYNQNQKQNQTRGRGRGRGWHNRGGGWNGGGATHPFPGGQKAAQTPTISGPPSESNLCRRYNEKSCQNHFSACSISTQNGILKLYHLCNFMCQKDGNVKKELCMGKHPRVDHK